MSRTPKKTAKKTAKRTAKKTAERTAEGAVRKTAERTRTRRQAEVPGTERPVHQDVEAAANEYVDARDERIGCTDREVQAKERLMGVMHRHGLSTYDYTDDNGEPRRIELVQTSETVKVRKRKLDPALAAVAE